MLSTLAHRFFQEGLFIVMHLPASRFSFRLCAVQTLHTRGADKPRVALGYFPDETLCASGSTNQNFRLTVFLEEEIIFSTV